MDKPKILLKSLTISLLALSLAGCGSFLYQPIQQTKARLVEAANRLLPIFVEHALWRPKERAWIGNVMRETDIRRLQEDVMDGIRMASSLGLDVSEIELPFAT